MNRRLAALLVPALLAVAGCTGTEAQRSTIPTGRAERPSPFADCAALTRPPGDAAPGPAGTPTPGPAATVTAGTPAPAGDGSRLPALTLNCFTGGAPVALRDIQGPAVINLWASWCPPCRKELPAFQQLSERTAGRLQVLGVNSRDTRTAAQAIGEDFGIRFPVLVDQGEALQRELRRNAIPLTLLVDAEGRVRHVDASGALDDVRLAALVRQHLGVAVPA
ncbi:TlpA disulfide reductase family protein [Micromonospora sp. KC213]|uniref:TlpA family protein disulfide reductase n=1 Tax=Micromonospora sp. KC213 TaxID=2530378 RepID=UPI001045CDB4|nr:TlpA disulfide reductase family protein [Micromonospora sp. KC213]TDC41988.1 TlpA family protein disulfide reductase [Micromonospora sp. KC213]